ncbi:hypothetical protein [Pleionea litopenaei]|uniref:Uncharacterized protein n=1 Tax=Pleionea litopenaei TaxID=3070815 RepID=A0AA51RT54_9GAMM|nr:hypothetical protein [Pleionea sp. HL-JVS1]WMS87014.1 hypothetical protein Q9312_17510 [Pleionea sp. HL-JVS1]
MSTASPNITLINDTAYVAQFVVRKGDQVIARIPGVEPKGKIQVPTADSYQVRATTILNKNTYQTAPKSANPGDKFLAQVLQISDQGTYDFQIVEGAGSKPDSMEFESTTNTPVIFNVMKDGKPLQSVTVSDNFNSESLYVGSNFYIYAVINGVTTATLNTNDGSAVISAENNTSALEADYFHLELN